MLAESRPGFPARARGGYAWLVLLAVALLAVNLRAGATSIGPVLTEIQRNLPLSDTGAGVLTALPGFVFALAGLSAAWLAGRIGLHPTLVVVGLLITLGLGARPFVPRPLFFAATVAALAGMALGNVLAPVFVKRHFPHRIGPVMALYTTMLAVGASLPTALTQPLAARLSTGWRAALAAWALPAAAAALVLVVVALRNDPGAPRVTHGASASLRSVARSPKALWIAAFFGLQSMNAYIQFGWVPTIYRAAGLSAADAGWMLTILTAWGIVAGIVVPILVTRLARLTGLVLVLSGLLVLGYGGLLWWPTTLPWLWASALGISGFCFPLAIMLISVRTRDVEVTAAVSGFSQSVGYFAAGLGPLVIGVLVHISGGWRVPLMGLMVGALALAVSGVFACSKGWVDDELGR